ncbi:MAG: acyl-CoA dehydrogenase family protein [Acetobacteraceae bacterium]|nr:acyl-CoA dehydrogenase family protein [Acetobacteraceae bacterium]
MSAADDQVRLIRDSAAAIATPGDLSRIRRLRFTLPGFDPAVVARMGALGWLALRVPEAAGGAGMGMAELAALAEALGRGLVAEPLVPLATIALPLLAEAGRTAEYAGGSRIALPALAERTGRFDPTEITTTAEMNRLTGNKRFVAGGMGADAFLVSARAGGTVGLWLVEARAAGVTLRADETTDGAAFASLALENADGLPLIEDARIALVRALDECAVATAAELVGVMDQALSMTLDYMRTREQFGRRIGSFQALQHRAADLAIQVALARASVDAAVAALDAGAQGARRAAAASQAKARASDAAMLVCRASIQLHGGIGYTDEADIGLYLKRAMVLAASFGNAALHRRRYAASAPPEDAA